MVKIDLNWFIKQLEREYNDEERQWILNRMQVSQLMSDYLESVRRWTDRDEGWAAVVMNTFEEKECSTCDIVSLGWLPGRTGGVFGNQTIRQRTIRFKIKCLIYKTG